MSIEGVSVSLLCELYNSIKCNAMAESETVNDCKEIYHVCDLQKNMCRVLKVKGTVQYLYGDKL